MRKVPTKERGAGSRPFPEVRGSTAKDNEQPRTYPTGLLFAGVYGAGGLHNQMPAYHAYPPSGAAEPNPLPNRLRSSVRVRRVMYLTFL